MRTLKHKHADLIHAWADGAKIQILYTDDPQYWEDRENPTWHPESVYRIKPEPKPDFDGIVIMQCVFDDKVFTVKQKLTFDGETGKIIKAELAQ